MATSGTPEPDEKKPEPEQKPPEPPKEPTPPPEPPAEEPVAEEAPEPVVLNEPEVIFDRPGPELRAKEQGPGANEPLKEDAVTVTPVPHAPREEQTVGGRYYALTADRIARRDEGIRYDVAECPNCKLLAELPPHSAPRTSYMACPRCGDTIRFTGAGVRDPNTEPLPAIAEDELRAQQA